ncbi:MAG TPA: hypothetical protein VJL08_01965, partial [Dehalococcoidia bacterium]|nr:hypothetical protein [Dehalococcoidia bacterium]
GSEGTLDLSKYKSNVLSVLRQALPPDYLQTQVEQVIKKGLPYALGDTNSFTINIPLKDRVKAAATAAKAELHKKDFFTALYDQMIAQVADAASSDVSGLPFSLNKDELETTLHTLLPPDWLMSQLDNAIDQLVPYLTKEKDHFAIKFDISDRMDALQTVVTNNLKKPENYDSLFDNIAGTALGANWQSGYQLPIGVELSGDEVKQIVKQVFDLNWYQSVVPQIVRQVFDYLKGNTDTLQVTLPLADRKPALAAAIGQLADKKLEAYFNSLPPSTPQQLAQMLANPPLGRLPDSRPLSLSYAQLKQLLGIDIGAQIAPFVTDSIPDEWVLNQSDLGNIFGAGGEDNLLTRARDIIKNGYTITDADLRNLLGSQVETLDNARQYIADGLVVTEKEAHTFLVNNAGEDEAQSFDNVRKQLGTARHWKMALWIIPGLILIGIGFLGGRHWSTRLIWTAAVLLATAVIIYVIFGPVFSSAAQPQIDKQLTQMVNDSHGAAAVLNEKVASLAENAINAFVSGIRRQAIILLFSSLVLTVIGIVWHLDDKRRGRHT